MSPDVVKRLRLLASVASVLLVVAILVVAWFLWRVRASLPQLEGSVAVAGLGAPVTVARDALGVPTVRGETRADVARALGWLHGQDRFFQMDVLRRVAAGELAEVFGERALPRDRAARMHGFRKLAQTVLARVSPAERAVLEAYTEGVNAGVRALRERPWEYLLLRDEPQPWRPEDCVLIVFAMTMDLQDEQGNYERSLMTLRDLHGIEAVAFFAPTMTPGDAALDGSTAPVAPIPGPRFIDLRKKKVGAHRALSPLPPIDPYPLFARDPEAVPGSNAFAVAGAHTTGGAALLANDMHLDHGLPNTWYRAVLEWRDAGTPRRVVGVTLPGTPAVVAGSNGQLAWGFTSAYVDTSDLVVVETDTAAKSLYRAHGHEGLLKIEQRPDTIRVKGGKDVTVEYAWTIWGPIVGANERGLPLALRWTAHDPEATNFTLLEMERAGTVKEGVDIAHRAGIPTQNILLADRTGAIAWTIAGRLPKRVGYDGRLPVSWTFGDRRWDGLLPPDEMPVVAGDATTVPGRIWSANQRHVGGDALAKLGDGAYRRPARAAQIRDGLARLERATEKDLLALQLDDRALFLERWHGLLMQTLTPAVTSARKPRAALRSFAEKWEGRASTGAVSYRLVREFRRAVHARIFQPIFAECVEAYPRFDWREFLLEDAAWTLLREQPLHLLAPEFSTWDELLVAAVDDTIKEIDKAGITLPQGNWGAVNRARVRHPFSYSFPWLSHWLDMPDDPLPGGDDMPRAQTPGHGASERLVVAPGREQDGLFHMPGGQSGHPMSPYYRAGHSAWVRGEPTPLLPGRPAHTLTLAPASPERAP